MVLRAGAASSAHLLEWRFTIKKNLEETLDLEQSEFLLKQWVAFTLTTALASLATSTLRKKQPAPGCGAPSTP